MSSRSRFGQVLDDYRGLEPEGADTWNPLHKDRELCHRLTLYELLCRALRSVPGEVDELRVLDLGCGNGRSTRVYLDFGLRPEQLTGVDLRPGAIELARQSHPGIRFSSYDGERLPVEDDSADWVAACTVFSSVRGSAARRHIVAEIERVLVPGGTVFYWDRDTAKDFAGADVLDPRRLFDGWTVREEQHVCVYGQIERLVEGRRRQRWLVPLLRRLGPAPSHRFALLTRRSG